MAQSNARAEAAQKLEESIRVGPSSYNAPVSIGEDIKHEPDRIQRSFWDTWTTAAEQAWKSNTLQNAAFYLDEWRVEAENTRLGMPKMSPDQANALYPWMGQKFIEPVDPQVAEMVSSRARELMELQAVIDAGSNSRIAAGTRWATQMAVGLFDPINVAAGLGAGKLVGLTGKAMGLGETLMFDSAAVGGRAMARDFLQIAAGNVPLEIPQAAMADYRGEEYGFEQTAQNVLITPAGFAGVGGLARWASPRVKALFQAAPKIDAVAAQSAVAALQTDRAVTSGRVAESIQLEQVRWLRDLDTAGARLEYPTSPAEFAQRPLYFSGLSNGYELSSLAGHAADRNLGPGIYLTDNPGLAESYAHTMGRFQDAEGGVFQGRLNIENPNLIDLERPLPEEVLAVIQKQLDELRPAETVRPVARGEGKLRDQVDPARTGPEFDLKGKTGTEVFDLLEELRESGKIQSTRSIQQQVSDALAAQGYDGYLYASKMEGVAHPTTVAMLFDPEFSGKARGLLDIERQYLPDDAAMTARTMELVKQEVERLSSIESDGLYDRTSHTLQIESVKTPQKTEIKAADAEAQYALVNEEVMRGLKEGILPENMKAQFDEIDEQLKLAEQQDSIWKAAMSCFVRSE